MTTLLDANVLIALIDREHVHHGAAERWLLASDEPFATCPITQGSLVRFLLRRGSTAGDVAVVLRTLRTSPRHRFWPDELAFDEISMAGVVGHRQVTDAYLAGLARARRARLATFDQALTAVHPDVAHLIDAG